ncbi:hypothetical protein [Pelagovum pacificum]|uniref:Lipoprotein n=1 Tax=Pelagovum pacificum TaxID=2588711 RepID=A0A5C5GDF0_9RHOB|nr:hypothetical protein [Pelagovum pacificum]QQA42485.1 hypothetical protein I8N54_17125 [Pelagovum pacificum]TNY31569.1 hypothetical protein FHY64_16320 [Pelagovum pacificum]
MHSITKLLLCTPLLLAACATPQERCLSSASRELRTLTRLAAETEANVARGYAVEEFQEVRERMTFCEVRNDEGQVVERELCRETDVVDRTRPVAIDVNAERQKLQQLRSRIATEESRVARAQQTCLATYPQ